MVRDIELIRNPAILQNKKLIIWGAGVGGKEIFLRLPKEIGIDVIGFIDSDIKKQGEYLSKPVYAPARLHEINDLERDGFAIIISVLSETMQDEIIKCIYNLGGENYDIYTKYAIDIAIDTFISDKEQVNYSELLVQLGDQRTRLDKMEMRLKLIEAGIARKAVFIYQSKKVASVTLKHSVMNVGIYGVHVHELLNRGVSAAYIKEAVLQGGGMVISLIREPVARQISLMWHYLGENPKEMMKQYGKFENIERNFFQIPNSEDEFEWYKKEMETVFGINVYEYSFDRDAGYSIIEKDGISLLLIKVEKLNSLEKVIADFLKEDDFKLCNYNLAKDKNYRHAYNEYLREVKIPTEYMDYYYKDNPYMDHFYTRDEKKRFYDKWSKSSR